MTSKQFTEDFQATIRSYINSDDIDKALYYIFKVVDDALIDREFDMIDGFLHIVDLTLFSVVLLIGLLTICNHYQKHLTNFSRVRLYLIDKVHKNYEAEEAKQILNGIE